MKDIGGWRYFDDETNLIFPWYTKPFLEKIYDWDITNWKVFEYGCGDSTFWWKKKSKEVISIDSNKNWADKTNSYYTDNKFDFINFPQKFIEDELFDCIIIDGEPVEWRDECIIPSIKSLKKNGILIIDNFKQESVGLSIWENADKYLKDKKFEILKEPNHNDWKTGYWII